MKINVEGLDFKVTFDPKLFADGQKFGICKFYEARIIVDSSTHPLMQKETLLHEVIHACLNRQGLEQQSEEAMLIEENFVNKLVPSLLQTMKKNKEFTRYILE